MSASSGIMLLLLLSPCSLLELAGCSMLDRPFIFTCPLSCTPPFVFPITAMSLSTEPEDDFTRCSGLVCTGRNLATLARLHTCVSGLVKCTLTICISSAAMP